MYYEEPRTPALPGEENVTDGSVDDYGTDWENGQRRAGRGNGKVRRHPLRCKNHLPG